MTDVVVHAEVVRAQEQLAQLQADIAAAQQAIEQVQIAAAGSVIKSVQRGVARLDGVTTDRPVTLTTVDTMKAVVHLLGVRGNGVLSGGTTLGLMHLATLVLTDSNTLTVSRISRPDSASFHELLVSYEVVEYY